METKGSMTFDETMRALHPHAQPILPNLWLGDINGGNIARSISTFNVLNVREDYITQLGGIKVSNGDGTLLPAGLDKAASWISEHWNPNGNRHILVHCMAGMDRSPMCIVWFLQRQYNLSIDDAYMWVKICLLYTSPSPRDGLLSRMPSS